MEDLQEEINGLKDTIKEKDEEIETLKDKIRDMRNSIEDIVYDLNRLT